MISSDDKQHYEDAINLIINRLGQRDFNPDHVEYIVGAIEMRVIHYKYNAADDPEIRAGLQRAVNGDG